ncbi:SRPBCC family protein [Flaviaesturariibacter terrae]
MKSFLTLLFSFLLVGASAQTWKLTRDKDGIRVYQSEGSGFRNIRVECTLPGTFGAFERTLRNVGAFPNWVYGNKQARLLKGGGDDYYYYSETALPWPLQNRDAGVHAHIERDPKGQWIRLTEQSEAGLVPLNPGKVRVTRSAISWHVTQAPAGQLHIVYLFQAEPGGSIPAWVANAFADKGPFESFRKLAALLRSN